MMDNFEKNITTQMQNDKLHFSTDNEIQARLIYHMQLKSSESSVRKNQILPSLSAILATKLIAWKLAIAALLLISFMGYNRFNHTQTITSVADTAQVINTIDTTNIIFEDSVSFN